MRKFEKVSFEEYNKETNGTLSDYNNYNIPTRSTKNSAGYDFESIIDFTLKPNESLVVPLGIKVCMNSDEMLLIIIRSNVGFKYNVRLCNQVGVIDSDYYNNTKNEGHMFVRLKNEGNSDYVVKKGDRFCQGIFVKYLITDDEINNMPIRDGWTYLDERK